MLVVVGGHSRNIGKTSVVAGLIQALPSWNWTAMKITQFGHGVCSASGRDCDCHLAPEHPYAIAEERQPNRSDTGRFLAAGARSSYWVRTAGGQLSNALPAIRQILASSQNLIIESNSILEFLAPDVYLVVLDFSQRDFKASSLRFLDTAAGYVLIDRGQRQHLWSQIPDGLLDRKPQFWVRPPQYVTAQLTDFVNERLEAARLSSSTA